MFALSLDGDLFVVGLDGAITKLNAPYVGAIKMLFSKLVDNVLYICVVLLTGDAILMTTKDGIHVSKQTEVKSQDSDQQIKYCELINNGSFALLYDKDMIYGDIGEEPELLEYENQLNYQKVSHTNDGDVIFFNDMSVLLFSKSEVDYYPHSDYDYDTDIESGPLQLKDDGTLYFMGVEYDEGVSKISSVKVGTHTYYYYLKKHVLMMFHTSLNLTLTRTDKISDNVKISKNVDNFYVHRTGVYYIMDATLYKRDHRNKKTKELDFLGDIRLPVKSNYDLNYTKGRYRFRSTKSAA